MTRPEIKSEVARVLSHMGCASVLQIAQDLPVLGGSIRSREPAIKRALRDLGAFGRKLGGWRCGRIANGTYHGNPGRFVPGSTWATARVECWTLARWRTASGTNVAPPVEVNP